MSDPDESISRPDEEIWIVAGVEGGVAVLVLDAGDEPPVVTEVDGSLLGDHAVEGTVLSVPLGAVGEPVWEDALPVADRGEE